MGVIWLLATQPNGQVREPASQQTRIIDAIIEMMQQTQRLRSSDPDLADLASEADRHLRWLLNNAKRWVPATEVEGSALRESLERMTTAIRDVPHDTTARSLYGKQSATIWLKKRRTAESTVLPRPVR